MTTQKIHILDITKIAAKPTSFNCIRCGQPIQEFDTQHCNKCLSILMFKGHIPIFREVTQKLET